MPKPKDYKKMAEDLSIPMADTLPALQEFEAVDDIPTEIIEWLGNNAHSVVQTGPVTFEMLVAVKKAADELEKMGKIAKDWAGEQLLLALAMSEHEKVRLDAEGTVLKVGYGRSGSKIDATKLLAQGVTVEQIQNATVEGNPYSFAQIVPAKKEG